MVDRHGRPRRFHGGPLARVNFELDALYHGVPFVNEVSAGERFVEALPGILAGLTGGESERIVPAALELDSTAWITHLDSIWEASSLPSDQDPSTAVNFKLDVLRALAHLPASQLAAFVHRMDGYEVSEIAKLLPRRQDKGPWSEESAERAVRRASSKVRSLCSIDVPGKRRQPVPPKHPIEVVDTVEAQLDEIRKSRRHPVADR